MRRLWLCMLSALLSVCLMAGPITAWAAESSPVKATISTERDAYEVGETATFDLTIENTGDTRVDSVAYEFQLPEGLEVSEGSSNTGFVGSIPAGGKSEVSLSVAVNGAVADSEGLIPLATEDGSAQTGDPITAEKGLAPAGDSLAASIIVLAVIAVAAVAIIASKRSRSATLSVLLVLGVSGFTLSGYQLANADEAKSNVSASKMISVGDDGYTVTAVVSYLPVSQSGDGTGQGGSGDADGTGGGDGSAPEGIVYQDDVIIVQPDQWSNISEDGLSAAIDPSLASEIGIGSIVAIMPGNGDYEGSAIKVQSLDIQEGSLLVSGSVPQLGEVVKSINVSGTTSDAVSIVPAEGIEVTENNPAESADGSMAKMARASGTIDASDLGFDDLTFTVTDGLVITLNPSIDYSVDYNFPTLNQCTLVANFNANVSYDWSDYKDFETELAHATFATPVPGLTVYASFSLVATASGEVHIDADMTTSAGVEFADGELDIISDKDFSYTASFDAELTAGVKPYAKINLLGGIPIADLAVEAGAGVGGSLIQRDIDFTCADMEAWMYIDVVTGEETTALSLAMDVFGIEREYHPLNKDNSPLWSIHVENGEVVDQCTWGNGDEGDPADNPNEGYPLLSDNGYGETPILDNLSGSSSYHNKLVEPFNITAGHSFTVGGEGNHSLAIDFTCDPGTIYRYTRMDFNGNVLSQRTEVFRGEEHPWFGDVIYKVEVLCGRATVYDITGWTVPPFSTGECETVDYPVQISEWDIELSPGEQVQLGFATDFADILGEEPEYRIEWHSDDFTIAEVDEDGLVTGMKPGTTEITLSLDDWFEQKCYVTVK